MKEKKIQWNLSRTGIESLAATLKSVRTRGEVGAMLGLSVRAVSQIEVSALRKIILALSRLESDKKHKP
jgi:DNA-directed RNA polymerase specialized sigma subunit